MGKKTIWAICALNVAASGFAVAWVTKPYWQPKPQPHVLPPSAATAPAKSEAACWAEFEQASAYEPAVQALAAMPPSVARQGRLAAYLGATADGKPPSPPSLVECARRAAATSAWGDGVEVGTDGFVWLQGMALDRGRSALERETALRSVMLAAQRKHKANPQGDPDGWREALAAYLLDNEFGRGSSVEGLALQAMSFAIAEKLAPLERAKVIERLGKLLDPRNGASEAVIVAALDVAAQLGAGELLGHARIIARQPPSNACQQAALAFLAGQGTEEDASWLSGYTPATATLQLAATNSRAFLEQRLLGQKTAAAAEARTADAR